MSKVRVVEPPETLGTGFPSAVGNKFRVIAAQKIDVPFDAGSKFRVVLIGDTEIPKIKHTKFESSV